jgi:hypothetical protein
VTVGKNVKDFADAGQLMAYARKATEKPDGRAAERADVLRFLRGEAESYEAEAQGNAEKNCHEAAARFANKAAAIRYVADRIERGDHIHGGG